MNKDETYWRQAIVQFRDVELARGDRRVNWSFDGSLQTAASGLPPTLRLTCGAFTVNEGWKEIRDVSFLTHIPVDMPLKALAALSADILEALGHPDRDVIICRLVTGEVV